MAEGWSDPVQVAENTAQPDSGWGSPAPPKEEAAPSTGWGPPPVEAKGPMPGFLESIGQGIQRGISDVGQTVTALSSTAPTPEKETSRAAEPLSWGDILEPGNLASKVGYRLGASSPTLAGGIGGAAAGSLVGPWGTLGGGVAGTAAGAAVQTLGPVFSQELKKTPDDPDGAWNRAMESAAISGAFSGASWALFPARFFQGPVKQLAFQAFGVQPTVAVAEKVAHNIHEDKPITEGLGQAYGEGAVMTAIPALGHAVVNNFRSPAVGRDPLPTQQELLTSAGQKLTEAQALTNQSMNPNLAPEAAQRFLRNADLLKEQAQFDLDRMNAPQRQQQKTAQADQLEAQASQPNITPIQAANLKQQARALRHSADEDGFMANLPSPLPERGKIATKWIENIQPELASDAALKTEPVLRYFRSSVAQWKDALVRKGEDYYYKWNKVDDAGKREFFNYIEGNLQGPPAVLAQHPWIQKAANEYRRQLDESYRLEKEMGSRADFLENYFPHIWENPIKAQQVFTNLQQNLGPTWFQKARYHDLIEAGENAGLRLKSDNPQELVTKRLLSGVDMVERMKLLQELHRNGVAVPVESAPRWITNPGRDNPHPWETIKAPDGREWLLAPDVQALWENGVRAKGLWANENLAGDAFRGWMKLKNAWVPIKLGLSLFHPVHVAHINMTNNMRRAFRETLGPGQQSLARRAVAIPEAMAQSVFETFLTATPIGTPHLGKTAREGWLTHPEQQNPQQRYLTGLLKEAGVSAQLSEQLRIAAKKDFRDALHNGQYLQAILPAMKRPLELLGKPVFEEWIPNLKTAAVIREAEALFRQRPDLINDPVNRRVALSAIGKQVDNRFGEMFYGNLFWNRTLKDAAIGSFLSLGWNLGFVREFGGGALEPIARRMMDAPTPTRKLIRDVTSKSSNAFLYTFSAIAFNAMMTKAMTGQDPEGMDYIFPRIGGLNPDGSPRRITNAFYTREVPMAMKHIEERQGVVAGLSQMLYHKLMFAPFTEMGTNRNYFGMQIYDENAPWFKRTQQFVSHLLTEQLNPMSISGAKRALELSGKPHTGMDVLKAALSGDRDVWMPVMGFGPAPAYASKDAIDNRIGYLYNKFVAPTEKPFREAEQLKERSEARTAYLQAIAKKDPAAIRQTALKLSALGVPNKTINKIQPGGNMKYMFSRLPVSQQVDLLKSMKADKFKQFYPGAVRKTKSDPEIIALTRLYYRGTP